MKILTLLSPRDPRNAAAPLYLIDKIEIKEKYLLKNIINFDLKVFLYNQINHFLEKVIYIYI